MAKQGTVSPGKVSSDTGEQEEKGPFPIVNPLLEQAVDDPLFKLLKNWWRQVLTVGLAIAAGFYAKYKFEETSALRQDEAAKSYSAVTEDYEELQSTLLQLDAARKAVVDAKPEEKEGKQKVVTDLEKQSESTRARLTNALEVLAESRAPYSQFSDLYRMLLMRGNADSKLDVATLSAWQGIEKADSAERMVAELKAYGGAKMLIDDPQTLVSARKILVDLGQRSHFVKTIAAYSLSRISITPEERNEALPIVEAVVAEYPEQADLFKGELSRLKG